MTLSIDWPDGALTQLQAEANRRRASVDAVIAELVNQLPAQITRRRLSFVGTLSAEPDFAERSEEILDSIIV